MSKIRKEDLGRTWRIRDRVGHWTTRTYDTAGHLVTRTDSRDRSNTVTILLANECSRKRPPPAVRQPPPFTYTPDLIASPSTPPVKRQPHLKWSS